MALSPLRARTRYAPALFASLSALIALSYAEPARAFSGAATDAYDGIDDDPVDVHGAADVYVQGNFNSPKSGMTDYRAFDTRSNAAALGMLRVTLAHKPDIVGFRLDAMVGDLANGYLGYDPAATAHPDLSRVLSYVEQAFVSVVIPVGRGLELDVGKFGTPIGLENNESLTNWNYSRALLYQLAEPSYQSGLRLTYPLTDELAASLFWVNGWDAMIFDGDGMRSLGVGSSWEPLDQLSFFGAYMAGPERAATNSSNPTLTFRNEIDGGGQFDLTSYLSFAATSDYGWDTAMGGVSWWGVGGYTQVAILSWLGAAARVEHYDDANGGYTSGTAQHLAEVTGTLEVHGTVKAVQWRGRLEYRRDESDRAVFETKTPLFVRHQDTVSASLIAGF